MKIKQHAAFKYDDGMRRAALTLSFCCANDVDFHLVTDILLAKEII